MPDAVVHLAFFSFLSFQTVSLPSARPDREPNVCFPVGRPQADRQKATEAGRPVVARRVTRV
jgi:hypothetical protein